MSELLERAGAEGSLELEDLQVFLADEHGGDLAICRDDYDGISTNAAIAMAPAEPRAVACHGLPSTAEWIDLQPALTAPIE